MLPKSTSTVIYCLKSSFALISDLLQHHRPCFLILVPVEGEFFLGMTIKALFFHNFWSENQSVLYFTFASFFQPTSGCSDIWYRKHYSLLHIYREIFICKMHTCTVRFNYFSFFEASARIFKLLFDWKRSYGWLESWQGLLFVTDNTCGSHFQSQVIAWLCRQTVVWVANNLWPPSQGSYRSHFVWSRIVRRLDK